MPQRIGDVERDRAVEFLREHMTAGRIDAQEFDQRLDVALTAKTSADLDPLFADLPGPRPGQAIEPAAGFQPPPWQGRSTTPARAPEPAPEEPNRWLGPVMAVMWPVTIMAITFVPWLGWGNFWWMIFIPMMISSAFGKNRHDRRERERSRLERQQRELDRRRRALGD